MQRSGPTVPMKHTYEELREVRPPKYKNMPYLSCLGFILRPLVSVLDVL
jgi:hypothetical protein